jgi:hypothetical protein
LAQAQLDPDRSRLTRFAAELEQEAEALEQSAASISLPPVAAPIQPQQVQQQSAITDRRHIDPDATQEKD